MFPSPFSARLWGGNSCRPLLRALNGTPNGQIGSSYYPHVFYWDCVWALPFPSWEGVHSPRSLHPPRCPISLRPGERQYRTGPSSSIRSRDVTPGHIGVLCDGVSPTSRSSWLLSLSTAHPWGTRLPTAGSASEGIIAPAGSQVIRLLCDVYYNSPRGFSSQHVD